MDVFQKRRLRRITEAVYQAASPPHSDVEPPPKHRFLPSAHAVVALVAVVALIVGVSLLKWVWASAESTSAAAKEAAMSDSQVSDSSPAVSQSGESSAEEVAGQSGNDANTGGATVMVYVSGCVNVPGVVTLPAGSRVIDALDAAGGATPEADLAAINLARKVVDGEQIDVTKPGEVSHSSGGSGGSGSGSGSGSAGSATGCVDLNTADQATLEQLDGVGPALAQRIITYRDQVGHIESAEQLDDVSGIGPALVARITPGVCR